MNDISRRGFIGGALAAAAAPRLVVGQGSRPNLVLGVVSDVHIGGRKGTAEAIKKTFAWFEANRVDAILCSGDIAHSGLISQLKAFADAWHSTFPNGKCSDGRPVELLIATGNHEFPSWPGRWKGFSREQLLKDSFQFEDNPKRIWDSFFGLKWEPFWRREVKGYTFFGAQWNAIWKDGKFNTALEDYMKEQAKSMDMSRPFFFTQHPHPRGTCHGRFSGCADGGAATRALSAFPNAISITGHSHCAITDERTVWQGAFTSIGAGCMHEGGSPFIYDNISARWHPNFKQKLMAPYFDPEAWGGDPGGGACELFEVYDDHLIVHRHSVPYGTPLGKPWTVPIPAKKGSLYDFASRAKNTLAPQFPDGAKVKIDVCAEGHPHEGVGHKGEPCICVTFPRAKTMSDGGRVFAYLVEASVRGKPVAKSLILANVCTRPEEEGNIDGECLISLKSLPAGQPVVVSVVPRNSFDQAGRPIVSAPHKMPG
jgi:hypothetical protein